MSDLQEPRVPISRRFGLCGLLENWTRGGSSYFLINHHRPEAQPSRCFSLFHRRLPAIKWIFNSVLRSNRCSNQTDRFPLGNQCPENLELTTAEQLRRPGRRKLRQCSRSEAH